jgi:hypothetical protein
MCENCSADVHHKTMKLMYEVLKEVMTDNQSPIKVGRWYCSLIAIAMITEGNFDMQKLFLSHQPHSNPLVIIKQRCRTTSIHLVHLTIIFLLGVMSGISTS